MSSAMIDRDRRLRLRHRHGPELDRQSARLRELSV